MGGRSLPPFLERGARTAGRADVAGRIAESNPSRPTRSVRTLNHLVDVTASWIERPRRVPTPTRAWNVNTQRNIGEPGIGPARAGRGLDQGDDGRRCGHSRPGRRARPKHPHPGSARVSDNAPPSLRRDPKEPVGGTHETLGRFAPREHVGFPPRDEACPGGRVACRIGPEGPPGPAGWGYPGRRTVRDENRRPILASGVYVGAF